MSQGDGKGGLGEIRPVGKEYVHCRRDSDTRAIVLALKVIYHGWEEAECMRIRKYKPHTIKTGIIPILLKIGMHNTGRARALTVNIG